MNKFITNFTSSGNNTALTSIFEEISKDFLNNFRPNFFKHVVIDNKSRMKNIYTFHDGILRMDGNKENRLGKLEKPNLFIEFQRRGNNVEETFINHQLENPKKYAGAYGYDLTFESYNLFYLDNDNELKIGTSSLQNKVEFNLMINLATRSDQEEMVAKIDSDIKQAVGYRLMVPTKFLLPVSLTALLKTVYFYRDVMEIKENQSLTVDDKVKLETSVNKRLIDRMDKYSKGFIKQYKDELIKEGIKNDLIFEVNPVIPIYYRLNKMEAGEGEKRNDVYEKFTITGSGFVEFENVINYVIELPQAIDGIDLEEILMNAANRKEKHDFFISRIHKRYEEERERSFEVRPRNFDELSLLFDEKDVKIEDDENIIDLKEWLVDNRDNPEPDKLDLAFKSDVILDIFDDISKEKKEEIFYLELHDGNKLMIPGKDFSFDKITLTVNIFKPSALKYYSFKLYILDSYIITTHKRKHLSRNMIGDILHRTPRR